MDLVFPCQRLWIGTLPVEVTVKPIRHLHLSVVPPDGVVHISAPEGMAPDHVRAYKVSNLGWIPRQQARFAAQERQRPRLLIERESHHLWGQRLLLHIEEVNAALHVVVQPRRLVLRVRPGTVADKRQSILSAWYRSELRREAAPLIQTWQERLAVQSNKLFVQAIRCQWGSCNPASRNIRLNTELAEKLKACLDTIVLHELAYLRVPHHGEAFAALLESCRPDWQDRKRLLQTLPPLEA